MAWVAPRTWVVGELVTAAMMNQHVRDNTIYLKTETDKLDDISHAEPARALDTIYQNSTKIRLITVTVNFDLDGWASGQAADCSVRAFVENATPPTVVVARAYYGNNDIASDGLNPEFFVTVPITFFVPPSEYYEVEKTTENNGSITLLDWHEWDLH